MRKRPRQAERARFDGENCTTVFTDIAEFGARIRNEDRSLVRGMLLEMPGEIFGDPRLGGLGGCGDEFLIIVLPGVPTKAVMEVLPHRLAKAIRRHNRRVAEPVRIQLRLAVHAGPVASDAASGTAITEAARIMEARVLEDRMTGEGRAGSHRFSGRLRPAEGRGEQAAE